jgi:hypothetical protein
MITFKEPQGLRLIHDFVSPEEETEIMQELDARPWAGLGVK